MGKNNAFLRFCRIRLARFLLKNACRIGGFCGKCRKKTAFFSTANGRKSGFYTKNKYFFVIPLAIFQIV